MDKKFIMTTSADTAKMLEECGFTLLHKTSAGWLFLNNNSPGAMIFSEDGKKHICFTDVYHC